LAQLTLFESPDAVLVDGESGRVVYTARFVDVHTADTWFAKLRREVNWHSERRLMYEREVDVPRLMASFRLDPPPSSTPAAILEAARRVTDGLSVPFNSVGLNLYRDGRDSVAPHNDHLDEIREGFPIALLSLGATRQMLVRAKDPPRRTTRIDLEAGSLLVMDACVRSLFLNR
jgi:alkylated DNA repair dioxygenase AlkB